MIRNRIFIKLTALLLIPYSEGGAYVGKWRRSNSSATAYRQTIR